MKIFLKMFIICSVFTLTSSIQAQSIKEVYNRIYGKEIVKSTQSITTKVDNTQKTIPTQPDPIKNSGLFKGSGSNSKYTTCNCELSSIYDNITKYFNKWQQKGEFEKEETYKERLKTESQNKFAKLCKDVIDSYIKVGYYDENSCNSSIKYSKFYTTLNNYCSSNEEHGLRILEYDSEKELFPIILCLDETTVRLSLNIYINDAPQFKKNWGNCSISYYLFDYYQYEGFLVPKTLTLNNNNKNYTINIPKEYLSPIRVYFDDLEIINPYLKGWYFEY